MTIQAQTITQTARRRPALAPLRPIRSNADLEAAIRLADQLAQDERRGRLGADAADYLEILLVLIERYEDEHFPIRKLPTARQRLAALVENSGMSASDLGRLLGNRALGSKLLTGEREPSKTHIRKLAEHFRLEPGYFL